MMQVVMPQEVVETLFVVGIIGGVFGLIGGFLGSKTQPDRIGPARDHRGDCPGHDRPNRRVRSDLASR